MADPKLIVAIVLAVLAVVLISIAAIISLAISRKYPAGDTKNRLRASGILTFLTAAFAIATSFVGILYARAKSSLAASARALMITFIILAVITGLMYVTVIGLNLSLRARDEVQTVDKNALTAAIILIAVGFVSLAVSAIMFFIIKRPTAVTTTTSTAIVTKPAVVKPAVVVKPATAKEVTTTTTSSTSEKPVPPPVPSRVTRRVIPASVTKTTSSSTTKSPP